VKLGIALFGEQRFVLGDIGENFFVGSVRADRFLVRGAFFHQCGEALLIELAARIGKLRFDFVVAFRERF
jgi:hypothetical protein